MTAFHTWYSLVILLRIAARSIIYSFLRISSFTTALGATFSLKITQSNQQLLAPAMGLNISPEIILCQEFFRLRPTRLMGILHNPRPRAVEE